MMHAFERKGVHKATAGLVLAQRLLHPPHCPYISHPSTCCHLSSQREVCVVAWEWLRPPQGRGLLSPRRQRALHWTQQPPRTGRFRLGLWCHRLGSMMSLWGDPQLERGRGQGGQILAGTSSTCPRPGLSAADGPSAVWIECLGEETLRFFHAWSNTQFGFSS